MYLDLFVLHQICRELTFPQIVQRKFDELWDMLNTNYLAVWADELTKIGYKNSRSRTNLQETPKIIEGNAEKSRRNQKKVYITVQMVLYVHPRPLLQV